MATPEDLETARSLLLLAGLGSGITATSESAPAPTSASAPTCASAPTSASASASGVTAAGVEGEGGVEWEMEEGGEDDDTYAQGGEDWDIELDVGGGGDAEEVVEMEEEGYWPSTPAPATATDSSVNDAASETEEMEEEGERTGEKRARAKRRGGKVGGGGKAKKTARRSRAKGGLSGGLFGFMRWTKEEDTRLRVVVDQVGLPRDWMSVAELMGGGVKNKQCRDRYIAKVDPALQLLNRDWTQAEFELLKSFVEQQTGQRIEWGPLAKELGRSNYDCAVRGKNYKRCLEEKSMKKGPFTPDEDKKIRKRVAEWNKKGDKKMGLWRDLGAELGRSSVRVEERWRIFLSKRKAD
ncbi:hypothetical protein B484DRAFT_175439 [Ochromonadaceae sp. CCMP2298]|nr:hypothetical protein B484DRAFT_175439 [Ochromonadaceae sp. CCMP2298]